VTALYASMLGLGVALWVTAGAWAWTTRHERRVWRRTRHDTSTAAIVLELEDRVHHLDLIEEQLEEQIERQRATVGDAR
jgi:hypothetical protein